MIEKSYSFFNLGCKNIEKLIDDDYLLLNHIVLPKGEGLPEHYSNSNVYIIVIRGSMKLILDKQEPHLYSCGQIINIPYNTKMSVSNYNEDILEFFVIKSPNPRNYEGV